LRVLGGFDFELFFALSLVLPLFKPLVGFTVFLLLDDPFDLFLAFSLIAVLHCVLDLKFKLYSFCC
jgi:hypothetical protein